jgi:hypothetical protein
MMKFLTIGVLMAALSVGSAAASLLQFSAITDTGAIASFTLDTSVPNTYSPDLYPDLPIRGVYLNAAYDLNFEGTNIALSDVTTGPGETGDGRPLTIMEVGPLFDHESLSLFLIFLDPTLVTPLSSDPLAYERSFVPFQSVLFPQIPPPRTHVDPLLTLTVSEIPEPSCVIGIAIMMVGAIALRRRWLRGASVESDPQNPDAG